MFWAKATEMIKLIIEDLISREPTRDNTIQVRDWVSRATLDIIGVAGMGQDFDSLRNPDNELSRSYKMIFRAPTLLDKILFIIGMLSGNMSFSHRIPIKRNRDIDTGAEAIRNTTRQMILEKKKKMKNSDIGRDVDIISVAMRDGKFDEENLVDQLMTFLGAGHETTSSAMQWAINALCKEPKVQTRLREEIHANLSPMMFDNPETFSAAQLDKLQYLHAVCNEVLRFHPSVPNTVRVAAKDTTLVGKVIPKGTFFVISPQLINHMEEYWGPDADVFNPDRFMGHGKANTGGATSNHALLTFLNGPRSCIGQGIAKAEMACLLAAMVGGFKFEFKDPDAKLRLRGGPTVSPRDGVIVKLIPVGEW